MYGDEFLHFSNFLLKGQPVWSRGGGDSRAKIKDSIRNVQTGVCC